MLVPALFGMDKTLMLDLKGNQSSLFEINGVDLEGMDDIEVKIALKTLYEKLSKVKTFKAYLTKDQVYLNTFDGEFGDSPANIIDIEDRLGEIDLRFLIDGPSFYWNSNYLNIFKLESIPEDISPALFQSLCRDDVSVVCTATLKENTLAVADLEKKRRFLFSNLLNPFKGEEEESHFNEATTLIEHLKRDETRIYSISVHFMVKGSDKSELEANSKDLIEVLKLKNLKAKQILRPDAALVNNLFPGVLPKRGELNVTSQALTNLILPRAEKLHDRGVKLTSRKGKPIFFNPFNEDSQNFNMVISGPSGRGKSVLANKIASDLLDLGIKVSIIDKGGSFKKLSLYHATNTNLLELLDLNEIKSFERSERILKTIRNFGQQRGQKLLVLDESWEFLKKQEDFMEVAFRTFRKENASILAITQSLEDFESTSIGRVILDNSYHKFLFAQKIGETKYLDSFEKEMLSTIGGIKGKYSEFLYHSEGRIKPLRFYQTDLEELLFNSNPADNGRFFNYVEANKFFFSFKGICKRYLNV